MQTILNRNTRNEEEMGRMKIKDNYQIDGNEWDMMG